MAPPRDRTRLGLHPLEDRTVPAADFDPTGVLVTFGGPAVHQARAIDELAQSRYADGVESVGGGVYRVGLATGVPVSGATWVFGKVKGVSTVSPDYRVELAATPNDPSFGQQTGFDAIDAATGWNVARGTGRTIVAVIDSGIDYRHPDLVANMWRNPGEIAGNGRDDDGNGYVDDVYGADTASNDGDPLDGYGHGTHVAGIVGASGNNGLGVSGVAWTTKLMAVKFIDDAGVGYTSGAIRAIDYAVSSGAKIINASWGGGPYNALLDAAIGRAEAAGVLVVTAAGNGGSNTDTSPFYPAGYVTGHGNVVTVAATTRSDGLASFSNYGRSTVTLAAPGESIYSTLPNGAYGTKSGTSMATPFVAGAAAVLWDANPTWSVQQVIARLKGTVDPLAGLTGKTITGGRLNLASLVGAPPPVVTPPPPTTGDTNGPRVTAAEFDGPSATVFDRARITFSEAIDPATFTKADITGFVGPGGPISVSAILPVAGSGNTQFQLMFSKRQSATGTYTMTIGSSVRDTAGNALTAYTLTGVLGSPSSPTVPTPPPTPPAPTPTPPPPSTDRQTYSAGAAAIADRKTTRVQIPVAGDFTIADLNVTVDVTHARTSDLSIRLIGPNGQMVTLFNRRDGANLSATVFDDQAATAIGAVASPFYGAVRPEQALSVFAGTSALGIWTIDIFDVVSGTTGTLNGVTLSFGTTASSMEPAYLAAMSVKSLTSTSDAVQSAVFEGRGDQFVG